MNKEGYHTPTLQKKRLSYYFKYLQLNYSCFFSLKCVINGRYNELIPRYYPLPVDSLKTRSTQYPATLLTG